MTDPQQPIPNAPTGLEVSMDDPKASKPKRLLGGIIGWGSVILAIVAILLTWVRSERNPVSDLATLEATIIGIAPRVGGPIHQLDVKENQFVAAGEPLFHIDPKPYELQCEIASANLLALRGDLANILRDIEGQRQRVAASEAIVAAARTRYAEARETYERIAPLLKRRYASPEQVDTARRAMEAAASGVDAAEAEAEAARSAVADPAPIQARITAAEALLGEAQLALSDCTVRAPFDCKIVGLNLAKGAFANPGISTLMILDMDTWHISANFPERVLHRIRAGQKAIVQIMTMPDRSFEGVVESIGWGVTSTPELPIAQVPFIRRELDWVRLAQRFPVRIRLTDPDIPSDALRSGATASVMIKADDAP